MAGACALPSAVAAAEAEPTGQVEEVVVTAQRRAERFVDVAASVTVKTGEQLEGSGVYGTRDLGLVTPGLTINFSGAFFQPTIRGVGTTVAGTGQDPNIALYIDGVFQASMYAALLEFNGVQSVEVLKGPQGTLYGRNATGGAIIVKTLNPSTEEFAADVAASYGSFAERQFKGYVNIPLSDRFAVNASVLLRKNHGYLRNLFYNERTAENEVAGTRLKALFRPSDELTITAAFDKLWQSDNTAFSYSPYRGNTPLRTTLAYRLGLAGDEDNVSLNTRPRSVVRRDAGSVTAEWNGDVGTFTGIVGVVDLTQPFRTDLDGTEASSPPVTNDQSFTTHVNTQKTVTAEAYYLSPADKPLRATLGAFFYDDNSRTVAVVLAGPATLQNVDANQDTTAYAAYGELTYDLTDSLHLTAGGRYSREKKDAFTLNRINNTTLLDRDATFKKFTPKATLLYDVTDHSTAYASYGQGFKSGAFNAGAAVTTPVKPEVVDAFEAGYKYAAGGLTFSAVGYHSSYKNIQQTALNLQNLSVLINAAKAKIYGFEGEVSAHLDEHWSAQGGVAYTHSEYTDFPGAIVYAPNPNGLGGNVQLPFPPVPGQVGTDASGFQLVRTPKFTAFGTLNYSYPVAGGRLDAGATASYSSKIFYDAGNRLIQKAFVNLNAQIGWTAPDDRYYVRISGKNLTDERRILSQRQSTFGDFVAFTPPRSVQVEVGFKY